jgi:hyperpolarization activated cyclic nucleotide-gated potassium channel 2
MLIAHINGCLQFIVPMLQSFPNDSWISLNNLQVVIFSHLSDKVFNSIIQILNQNSDWTEKYTVTLFKALSHMLSIGYGKSI